MFSIADELESREVELCPVCKENPKREIYKTCSKECSKILTDFKKIKYQKNYRKRPYVMEKMKIYMRKYNQREYVKARMRAYKQRPEVIEKRRLYYIEYNKRRKNEIRNT